MRESAREKGIKEYECTHIMHTKNDRKRKRKRIDKKEGHDDS